MSTLTQGSTFQSCSLVLYCLLHLFFAPTVQGCPQTFPTIKISPSPVPRRRQTIYWNFFPQQCPPSYTALLMGGFCRTNRIYSLSLLGEKVLSSNINADCVNCIVVQKIAAQAISILILSTLTEYHAPST